MSKIRTAGADLQKINNRTCKKYATEKGEKIVLAFEKCRIPFFARYNNAEISVIYDGNYTANVDEIIRKIMSGAYDEIVAELKRKKNDSGYKVLFPEIANVLNTSVSFLKSRPDEVQEILCTKYVNLWYCDTPTIKRELSQILNLDEEPQYVSAEVQRKRAEKIRQEQAEIENRERFERDRRF